MRQTEALMHKQKRIILLGRICAGIMLLSLFPAPHVYAQCPETFKEKGLELYRTHHLEPGRMDQAIRMYEKALDLKPGDYQALWRLAEMYQNYARMLDEEQRERKIRMWKKGTDYGKRAVEVNPEGKEGHFYYMSNMGALAQFKGTLSSIWKFRKIKREMDRTLELDPDYPPALVARGQYLTEMPGLFGGDEQEAYRLYQRAVEVDPGYRVAYIYMARLDAKNRRYDTAAEHLNRIIQCPEEDRSGNWATIDRPWAEELLLEIYKQREKENP